MGVALTPNAFLVRNTVGAPSSFSVCGWTRIDTDRNQFTILRYWAANSVGGGGFQLTVDADLQLILFECTDFTDLLGSTGPTLSLGAWYFFGLTTIVDDIPNNVEFYLAEQGDPTLTQDTLSYEGAYQYANHYVGARPGADGSNGAFRLHGSVAHDRVWQSVTLTPTEMLAEYQSATAVKAGAWAVWPMADSATAVEDATANNRDLTQTTGTGSVTTTDGPFDTAIVEGTLDGTLPALTGDISGGATIAAALAATLPALAASIDGTATVTGGVAATLPALAGDLAASTSVPAAIAATLPAIEATTTGAVEAAGELTATLPSLTASTAGSLTATSELAGTLPAVQADVAADATINATLGATLPTLDASADAAVTAVGALDANLPALMASFSEEEIVAGAIAASLPALTSSVEGTAAAEAVLAGELPVLVASIAALTEDRQSTVAAGTYREPAVTGYRDPAGLTYRESAA